MYRSDADAALETALGILEALQKAKDAQAIAEEAITKAQGQITDIETSLDNVCCCLFLTWLGRWFGMVVTALVTST